MGILPRCPGLYREPLLRVGIVDFIVSVMGQSFTSAADKTAASGTSGYIAPGRSTS